LDKAASLRRGQLGDELVVDRAYYRRVVETAKALSGQIQSGTEAVYK
jgi:hypothetical protein